MPCDHEILNKRTMPHAKVGIDSALRGRTFFQRISKFNIPITNLRVEVD